MLLVASWYPSRGDPIAGRFVADQAAALSATGQVAPFVVSFDPATITGAGQLRTRMARAVADLAAGAVFARDDVFTVDGAMTPREIPVARLAVAGGRDPGAGVLYAAVARERALLALAGRLPDPRAARGGARLDVPAPFMVHAHTVYPDGVAAVGLAKRLGLPLVITEHASFVGRLVASPPIRAAYVEAVTFARRLVVVSRVLADEITAALPEIAAKVTVIPNAVDLGAFHLPVPGERRSDELLFVGYRKESKGLDTLLAAFARVHAQRPATTLRLIGSSPTAALENGWRRAAARYGVADVVRFDPPGDRATVAQAMATATLFVHPSPRETFGVVAVEALASGLPVIAADSGGVTEIMGPQPARFGAVVAPDDPVALAAAIAAALDRRSTFDPATLRAAAAERFGSEAVAHSLLEVYGRLPAAPGSPTVSARSERAVAPAAADARVVRHVVVALDPGRLAALAELPAAIRSTLVVVTSAAASDAPAGLAGLVTARLHGGVKALAAAAALGHPGGGGWRVYRVVRHPILFARRRGLLPGLERSLLTAGTAAIRQALAVAAGSDSTAGTGTRPPDLVCLDGVDYLAAAEVVAAGEASLAPGGLAWLGDRAAPG